MTVSIKTLASLACVALLAGCATFYEIPIETPLTPKLYISKFQRVLIAGFVSGGSEDVDANIETARLLRSQLRRNSALEVIRLGGPKTPEPGLTARALELASTLARGGRR